MANSKEKDLSHPKYDHKVCMRSREDTTTPWITAMVLYPPCRLFVTDYNNRTLKLANMSFKEISECKRVNGQPWDITGLFHDTVAVTLPNEKRIQFVDITPKEWRIKRTLRVGNQYWGIGKCGRNLIVSSLSPPALHVINRNGEVLNTISTNERDEKIFCRPLFIQTNRTSIVVSDRDRKAVIVLDSDGNLQNQYRTDGGPTGLTFATDGSMFLSIRNGSKKVISISKEGFQRNVILDTINDPYALACFFQEMELYVSCFGDENVFVYKI